MTWLDLWRAQHPTPAPLVLPERYQQARLEKCSPVQRECIHKYLQQFWEVAPQGRAPIFLGESGVGKSMAAAVLITLLHERAKLDMRWESAGQWVVKDRTLPREEHASWVRKMQQIPILVLDDIHFVTVAEVSTFAVLTAVLTGRWDACKPTIITANLSLPAGTEWDALATIYTAALARRMRDAGEGFTVLT